MWTTKQSMFGFFICFFWNHKDKSRPTVVIPIHKKEEKQKRRPMSYTLPLSIVKAFKVPQMLLQLMPNIECQSMHRPLNPDSSGCKSNYEDSDGDIKLVKCTTMVLEEKVGVKFERDVFEQDAIRALERRKKERCSENGVDDTGSKLDVKSNWSKKSMQKKMF